jgi:hypothetical protein
VTQNLIHKVISSSTEGLLKYQFRDWTYIIHPNKTDWVICVADSGYTFYNNSFFVNLFSYLSLPHDKHKRYIKSWTKKVMGFDKVDKHFYPDVLYGDYDWSDQFVVKDVMEKGTLME